MCFSPEASFAAAAFTGLVGTAALARNSRPQETALAVIPLLFGAQQAIEGALWLQLPDGPAVTPLAVAFLVFAKLLWPVWMPLAVWAAEPQVWRRRALLACLALGLGASAHELREIVTGPVSVEAVHHHLVYWTGRYSGWPVKAAYVAAAGLPLLIASRRMLNVLGLIMIGGCLVAYLAYFKAFISVWCFFAAVASVVLLVHVERARRERPLHAPNRRPLE